MRKMIGFRVFFIMFVVLAINASGVVEYNYDIAKSLHGTTTTESGIGFCKPGDILMYLGLNASGGCTGNDETGWVKFDLPDFGAIGQVITSVEIDIYVHSYQCSRPWPGLQTYRIADDSWTAWTIHNGWPVSSDWFQDRPVGTEWDGTSGLRTTAITSWFGPGKESLTGGETLSIRLTPVDVGSGIGRQRLHTGYFTLHITTVKGKPDINDDGIVEFKDYAVLASQWQQAPVVPSADVSGDGFVDAEDLRLFANEWLWAEVSPFKAVEPNPQNHQTCVGPNTNFKWSHVWGARTYDVYLGADYNDVNDAYEFSAEYMGNQESNSWDPCGLNIDTIYYWRIDTRSSGGVTKGDVWSFRTWVEPTLHGWWKFDEGQGFDAKDSACSNHGTLIGPPAWVAGNTGSYALDFNGVSDYVDCGNDERLDLGSGSFTLSAWIKTSVTNDEQDMIVGHYCGSYSGHYPYVSIRMDGSNRARTQIRDNDRNKAEVIGTRNIENGRWHHVVAVRDTDTLYLYVDGQSDGTPSDASAVGDVVGSQPWTIGVSKDYQGTLKGYINATIDDVRIYSRALSSGEILQLCMEGLGVKAFGPNPIDKALGVDPRIVLTWSPGKDADSHDVYFGTAFEDVNDATSGSNEFIGNQDVNSWNPYSYDANGLELNSTYYWRIDEVNASGSAKGDVWSFTTWSEPNLQGWWEFEEGSGINTGDSSGSGNHGTLVGPPAWVAGNVGTYALDFDGIDDYVHIPDNGSLDLTKFSISLWFKMNSLGDGSDDDIIEKIEQGMNDDHINFRLLVDDTPTDKIFAGIANGSTTSYITSDNSITAGQWYHVVFVFDGTNSMMYVDAVLQQDVKQPGFTPYTSGDQPVRLGCRSWSGYTSAFFNGIIDDVRVYDKALFSDQIDQIYQQGTD